MMGKKDLSSEVTFLQEMKKNWPDFCTAEDFTTDTTLYICVAKRFRSNARYFLYHTITLISGKEASKQLGPSGGAVFELKITDKHGPYIKKVDDRYIFDMKKWRDETGTPMVTFNSIPQQAYYG